MEFTKQFSEAAQAAIIRKMEADKWENLPWLAKLVQENIRQSLSHPATLQGPSITGPDIDDAVSRLESAWKAPSEPVDICGCQIGRCTCTDQMKATEVAGGVKGPDGRGDAFESNDFSHVDGYDWRIIVSDRTKNSANSWAEHFNYRPAQEEFENQFRHFHARTHYVHVNQWVDGDWITITSDYVPHWNKEKPVETFTATEEWPNMKTHRIKFWDQRIGAYNYVYFDRHPGGIVLHKYHSTKCYAVVQKRPEGV